MMKAVNGDKVEEDNGEEWIEILQCETRPPAVINNNYSQRGAYNKTIEYCQLDESDVSPN